jgi:superfamily II DNA or RNA helicase
LSDRHDSQNPNPPQINLAPTLRPCQSDVIALVALEIAAGRCRILLVAPTGAGKTVIATALIAQDVAQGRRVLFLAHRRELIQQASAKLYAVGVDHGIVQAGFPTRPGAKVQVASIPTPHRRAVRSTVMDLPPALSSWSMKPITFGPGAEAIPASRAILAARVGDPTLTEESPI